MGGDPLAVLVVEGWQGARPRPARRLDEEVDLEPEELRALRLRGDDVGGDDLLDGHHDRPRGAGDEQVDVGEVVGRPRELDVAVLVRAPRVHEGDVRADRGNREQLIAGVGIDDRAEAALLDELRAERGAGGEERQPHHRGPQPADEHPLRELAVLDRAVGDGRREAAGEAVRAEPDVARDDGAKGARGEQELDLEGAGERDELEVALAGAGERAGGSDGLAAQDGAAEADARAVRHERDRVVPAAEPHPWNLGGALLEEGAQALAGLGLGERLDRRLPLDREPLLERRVEPVGNAPLDQPQPGRRHLREPGGEGERLVARGLGRVRGGHVDEADLARLRGAEPLAEEQQARRLGAADEPRQPLRAAAAGDDPEPDLGAADQRRPLAHDAEVAGERELAAAAERVPCDLGDDGLRQALHAEERRPGRGRRCAPSPRPRSAHRGTPRASRPP